MKRDRIAEILDTIDTGLQSTPEASYGETPWDGATTGPRTCARCQTGELDDDTGELCPPCRSFLLGDTDEDPARPGEVPQIPYGISQAEFEARVAEIRSTGEAFETFAERIVELGAQIAEALRPIAAIVLTLPDDVLTLIAGQREPTDDEIARLSAAIDERRVELLPPFPALLEPGDAITVDGTDYVVEARTEDGYALLPIADH